MIIIACLTFLLADGQLLIYVAYAVSPYIGYLWLGSTVLDDGRKHFSKQYRAPKERQIHGLSVERDGSVADSLVHVAVQFVS